MTKNYFTRAANELCSALSQTISGSFLASFATRATPAETLGLGLVMGVGLTLVRLRRGTMSTPEPRG
jgi:hypothetical protein